MSHVMPTYARQPLAFTQGEGVFLIDAAGKRYLDALAGIAVVSVGHCHPKLVKAIQDQAQRLIHTSNIFEITLQERLADRLCAISGMENAFFCNSGLEANEAAIKLARLYGNHKGIDVPTIIVTEKSFQGRSMATLTASGSRKVQAGFEPLVAGFARVPYDDVTAVRQVAANNKKIVALLVEPITGEGGINIPSANYLQELRALCDQNGWLLMLDEVQTGMGRTGKWFGFQHSNIAPDVITLAKGLGGGVPIGACLARSHAAQLFQPGKHGSTFGGNLLACAAALAVLDIMESEGVVENAAKTGEYLLGRLRQELRGVAGIAQIRGQGLMIGIELDRACSDLVGTALARGLIINVTADNVVRLVPPLVFSVEHADLLASTLVPMLREFLAAAPARSVA